MSTDNPRVTCSIHNGTRKSIVCAFCFRNNEEIIRNKYLFSQQNDDIFHIIDQIKVTVVNRVCPSLIREGKWNYNNIPFKLNITFHSFYDSLVLLALLKIRQKFFQYLFIYFLDQFFVSFLIMLIIAQFVFNLFKN